MNADMLVGRPGANSGCEQSQQGSPLFDDLVGAREHGGRHIEPQRFGSFEVDDQLVLHGRLHRQIGRLLALEDAIDVASPRRN